MIFIWKKEKDGTIVPVLNDAKLQQKFPWETKDFLKNPKKYLKFWNENYFISESEIKNPKLDSEGKFVVEKTKIELVEEGRLEVLEMGEKVVDGAIVVVPKPTDEKIYKWVQGTTLDWVVDEEATFEKEISEELSNIQKVREEEEQKIKSKENALLLKNDLEKVLALEKFSGNGQNNKNKKIKDKIKAKISEAEAIING